MYLTLPAFFGLLGRFDTPAWGEDHFGIVGIDQFVKLL